MGGNGESLQGHGKKRVGRNQKTSAEREEAGGRSIETSRIDHDQTLP